MSKKHLKKKKKEMSALDGLISKMRSRGPGERETFVRNRSITRNSIRDCVHSVAWVTIDGRGNELKQLNGKKYITLRDKACVGTLRDCHHILVYRVFAQRLYESRILSETDDTICLQVILEHNLDKPTKQRSSKQVLRGQLLFPEAVKSRA